MKPASRRKSNFENQTTGSNVRKVGKWCGKLSNSSSKSRVTSEESCRKGVGEGSGVGEDVGEDGYERDGMGLGEERMTLWSWCLLAMWLFMAYFLFRTLSQRSHLNLGESGAWGGD
jgi:hypothetical protein